MGGPIIPKKGLLESNFKFVTPGAAVNDGSHQIFQVDFIEDGKTIRGFYKKLNPQKDYPELLAKISVAVSLFKRLFQGKRSAEERLVFDKEGTILGTLSIGVERFRPFSFSSEPAPADPSARELAIPSTETLITHNIMEILLGRWFLDDDDGHPHNLSCAGDIDFDMFIYWFTIHIKEPRPIIGIPKTAINLTEKDWERFPNVRDSMPYHWPTFTHPGQESFKTGLPGEGIILQLLPKAYADPLQFENLARYPEAQEQKMAAGLKALLTYQPEMMRKRLTELFGDIALNYTSLDASKPLLRNIYEEKFPALCNEKTNIATFVDFMMKIYQEHYDSLYRVIVFHKGCENNGYGLAMPATHQALYRKPSYYTKIKSWVEEQNKTFFSKDAPDLNYSLTELRRRYHQIWRDSFALTIIDLLTRSSELTKAVLLTAGKKNTNADFLEVDEKSKNTNDPNLTKAAELFRGIPSISKDKVAQLISVDKESRLREALLLLIDFTNEFKTVAITYYDKDLDLSDADNLAFHKGLQNLLDNESTIRECLAQTSSFAQTFHKITTELASLPRDIHFRNHLATTDQQIEENLDCSRKNELLPLTDPRVVQEFNRNLFTWAKRETSASFEHAINDIIDNYYAALLNYKRTRTNPVKEYLKSSTHQAGDNRLAYILSSGNEETGALNTLLIEHLALRVIKKYPCSYQVAVINKTFNAHLELFTKAAVYYAKTDKSLTHLCNDQGVSQFFNAMYEWLGNLPQEKFTTILNAALSEYSQSLKWGATLFRGANRENEVRGYCKDYRNNAKIVAMIFTKGADSSTLNEVLFLRLVTAIKEEISKNPQQFKHSGCALIAQFKADEHKAFFLPQLKAHAEAPSHIQDKRQASQTAQAFVPH